MSITERTRYFLLGSGWTQERLAQEIGIHVVSLNRYMNKQKRRSTGERLAEFLGSQRAALICQPKTAPEVEPRSELRPDIWPPDTTQSSTDPEA